MKIIVVGNGGIGSNVLPALVKLMKLFPEKLPQRLLIIDGDTVEHKNLFRQDFAVSNLGTNKAMASAGYLATIAESLNGKEFVIDAMAEYLKESNIDVIEEGDIVLTGVDNYITRRVIEDRAKKLKDITIIYGGNEYHDGDVNVFIRRNGENITQPLTERHPEILTKDRFPDEIPCEEAAISSPQLVLANMSSALYMLESLYQIFVVGKHGYKEKMYNVNTGDVRCLR